MPDYIKSPMNYTGGKYKILEHIIPSFPESINNFVDLFAGGLNVGINVQADTIYANDQITYLVELYKLFQDTPIDSLLSAIKERIAYFNLSQTNAEGYNALRAEYNQSKSLLDLFVLTCYLWQPSVQAGQPDKLLGYELYTSPYVPTVASGALTIAFGDFKNYWIGDRAGRTVQRLNELYATNGQIGYVATERVDGKVILPEAIQLLQQA